MSGPRRLAASTPWEQAVYVTHAYAQLHEAKGETGPDPFTPARAIVDLGFLAQLGVRSIDGTWVCEARG